MNLFFTIFAEVFIDGLLCIIKTKNIKNENNVQNNGNIVNRISSSKFFKLF